MSRFNLIETLENRQLFAGMPGHFGPPGGFGGNQEAISQPLTTTTPVAIFKGTVKFSDDSSNRPFALMILTEGTDGAVTASIPGRHGPVSLTGTKSGSTYTLSGTSNDSTIAITATVDDSGNVTGTFTRTYTENGTTETDTGALTLTKSDSTTPPEGGPRGGHGGPGGGHHGAPDAGGTDIVQPLAVYDGTLTLSDSTTKHFDLAILTENADGTVTAHLGHGKDGIDLTGTKSGSTYTLTGTKDGVSVSVTATVDDSGNVTGTYSKTTTASDGTATTESGTISLSKRTPGQPCVPPSDSSDSSSSSDSSTGSDSSTTTTTTTTTATTAKTLAASSSSSSSTHTRPTVSNLVTYRGTMTIGGRTGEVTIQTYTLSTGQTLVTFRSRGLLGRRTLVLQATISGNTITASRTDGERSVSVNLTTSTDGSITGSVVLKKGTIERSLTIDADKVTTSSTTA